MDTKISLALIVKNVEKTLDRCLDTFSPCVDGIILVDTGSKDKTLEIAKKYTDKIYHFDWIDDFSAARNFSFSKCTGDYIFWCCHPKTLVHTENGLRPISEISVGDKVLTHGGVYKSVTKVYTQKYKGDVYKIKSNFSAEDVIITPNHEFYSTKGAQCNTGVKFCTPNCKKQWSKRPLKKTGGLSRQCKQPYSNYDYKYNAVESLNEGDIIAYPRCKQVIYDLFFTDIESGYEYRSKCKNKIPEKLEITPEYMRLIGYYIAEGTTNKNIVSFCFHKDENKYHEDVLSLMSDFFNLGGSKSYLDNKCTISFNSTILARYFSKTFNGLQPTRRLPSEWLGLSDGHLGEFIKGYFRGDGDDCSDSFRITTTSPHLVYQVKEILSRFGILPHLTPYKTTRNTAWKICVGGGSKSVFEALISAKHSNQPPYFNRNKYYYSDENYIYSPISKMEIDTYEGSVYNLEVEGDHTYVTDHMICHNCDGDDYILPEDVQKLKEFDFADYDMITCPYVYSHDEYGNPQLITARERIIKRSLGLKWVEPIHEYLPMDGLNIGISDIHTHHNKQHGTSERNLAILERIVEKKPSTRNLYYLAREYADFGRIDEAIERFEDYLGLGGGFWENKFQAHYKLANCYLSKGDEAKFKEHIFKAIDMEDRIAEPFYFLALFYMNKRQFDKAIPWYEHCLKIDRPKELLSSYLPMYYTWLPHLNLCYCYNSIGKYKEAYEHNKKALEYRPNDSRALANDKLLKNQVIREESLKDGKGKKLHLGCGAKRIEGYVNVDLFNGAQVDEVFEFDVIPYKDNTIGAIYSEHALEHVPFARAERALKEWYRVLKPGGKVSLYIPDFEECCRAYLNAPLESPRFMDTRAWYKLTIYGVQESQGGEPDEAQIHMCGFSKEEIRIVMERNGFIVDSVENYGGPGQKPSYGTPSMAIMARKPGGGHKSESAPLKIGWISEENWVAAQTRIRVLKVNDWLNTQGYDSSLATFQDIIDQGYDVAIIGKKFNEEYYNGVKMLKDNNITVYCDLCESILEYAYVEEMLELCDKVICCSNELAEQVKRVNSNVIVIEDAYEV